MADPQIKFKRSSVALKRPALDNVATGEFAINTYDGRLFTRVDTGGVGIGTTVSNLTPWTENFGSESITYSGIQTSGGGITTNFASVTLSGLTPTGFNTTYTRQSNGFVLDTGTVASGNALFDTDSSYYYYVDSGDNSRMLIFSESDNSWVGVASTGSSPSTEYNVLTTSNLSPSSFNQTYVRQATGFILDTGTVASGNAIFRTNSSHYYYVASTGSDPEDRIVIWSEEDNAWLTVFDFNDPDFREGNISNGQALGSSFIFNATLATASDTFNGRNVPDADDADVTYDTTKDYSSLTLDANISDFDGDYTRQSFKANLDTGTVSSDNALFNATSEYWWFLKDDDNSKMIIFDSVAGNWTYVGKTGADFSSAANNTAVGEVNMVESQTITSVQYESNANQPNANHSEITYAALSGANYTSVSNNDALGAGTTFVTVTAGKTTADSRFVPTASGSIVYGTSNVAITTSLVGVVTFTTGGNLILEGTVDGRDVATDGSNQDNLQTLTGVSAGSTTLGTFTGTTISDNKDIKTALQEIETSLDNVVGGNSGAASVLVSSTATDASFFPTFVADNNGSDTQESFKTDAGITYNPSSNILTVSGSVAANVTGNLTGDVTGTATTATNLADAANITTGTISNDRLPSTITKNLTGNVTGNATSADTVDVTDASSTNDTFNPVFSDGSGSGETIMMDVGLIYNPSSNTLTAGTFSGSLSGTASVADNVDVVNVSTTDLDLTLTMSDGSNTTTGRTLGMDSDLTYNPSTNTLTAGTVVGNLTGNVTGNLVGNVTGDVTGTASTATHAVQLQTSRNIGGVAFNGTADINLPGVNAAGNQNTSGTAAGLSGSPSITVTDITAVGNVSIAGTLTYEEVTSVDAIGIVTAQTGVRITTGGLVVSAGGATISGGITGDLTGVASTATHAVQLQTARTIGGVSFDGTADINLPGVNATGNQDTTGNAGTATSLATARTIGGVSFDGTSNITLPGVNAAGNQDTTGNAGTATSLATARTIHGVSFDGTSNIDLSEVIQDTVGAMFSSNTETGITVTYEDSDGTIDLVVGTLNQDTSGTAALAEGLTGTPNITVGVVTASSLDISGNVDVDGTLEADAITIDGVTLSETIADTVGGMVTSNTETGITVTYDDSDNTLDFVIGTLNQDTTGNAGTATSLATARTIAGVSFDGTADISLNNNAITNGAGYITTSFTNTNQLTNGAGYITASDDITGTASFFNVTTNNNTDETLFPLFVDGTSGSQGGEVDSSITWNPSTNILRIADPTGGFNGVLTGTATTATHAVQLQTARNIGGVSFDGTADINLPGVNATGNQDTTGNAGTATSLATARTIAGVSFDGTANISLNNNAITNGAGYITTSFTNTNQLTNGAGFITASDNITGTAAGLSGTPNLNVGVVTATSFVGNGANLTGITTLIQAGSNVTVTTSGGITTISAGDQDSQTLNSVLGFGNTSNLGMSVGVVTATGGDFNGNVSVGGTISLGDDDQILFGAGNDLKIYHDGDHSYVSDEGQGNLKFRSNAFKFTNVAESKTGLVVNPPTAVEAYFNGSKKLETTNDGVIVTGVLTATSFVGDGSGLTNVGMDTSVINSTQIQSGIITATSQFYPPSLTTTERDAITFSTGAFIFNETENKLQVFIGSTWASLTVDIDPYSIINM